jgi:hypothetical protein
MQSHCEKLHAADGSVLGRLSSKNLVIAHGVYYIDSWYTKGYPASLNATHHPAHAGESSSPCFPVLPYFLVPHVCGPQCETEVFANSGRGRARGPVVAFMSASVDVFCLAEREVRARAGHAATHSSMPMPSKMFHVCGPQGKAGVTADGVRRRASGLVSAFIAATNDRFSPSLPTLRAPAGCAATHSSMSTHCDRIELSNCVVCVSRERALFIERNRRGHLQNCQKPSTRKPLGSTTLLHIDT